MSNLATAIAYEAGFQAYCDEMYRQDGTYSPAERAITTIAHAMRLVYLGACAYTSQEHKTHHYVVSGVAMALCVAHYHKRFPLFTEEEE